VPVPTWDSDVDACRDGVAQPVPGQRGGQAQRRPRRAVRNLEQVRIGVVCGIGPVEQAAAELLEDAESRRAYSRRSDSPPARAWV